MKKIVFGITSLNIGGAERVLIDIVNKICLKYEITIFTLYGNGILEKQLRPEIKLISLYNKQYDEFSKINKKIIPIKVLQGGNRIYKKYIDGKFDIQIAFLEGPITRIFNKGTNIKKIVWVHNDISKVFGEKTKAKIKLKIDKKNYNKYDKIIFVSNQNKDAFNKLYNCKNLEKKEEIICNYIDKERIIEKSKCEEKDIDIIDKSATSIVIVARLVKQKGLDRLIKIHSKLIKEKVFHKIYVIGEGVERKNLDNLIKELNVENTFYLIGKKENPYTYMKKADYIALLSYYEGYGMVIEEAKILNKKIIITNTAATEAVNQYSNKIILENTEQDIYEGLKKILTNQIAFKETNQEYDNLFLIKKIEEILN